MWLKIRFGSIRGRIDLSELIGLSRIGFWPFFIKRNKKRFSDWLGMIRIGSDTDVGMNRNSSDWLGINFNPILLSGIVINWNECNKIFYLHSFSNFPFKRNFLSYYDCKIIVYSAPREKIVYFASECLMPEQNECNNHTSKINVSPVLHTIFCPAGGKKMHFLTR